MSSLCVKYKVSVHCTVLWHYCKARCCDLEPQGSQRLALALFLSSFTPLVLCCRLRNVEGTYSDFVFLVLNVRKSDMRQAARNADFCRAHVYTLLLMFDTRARILFRPECVPT